MTTPHHPARKPAAEPQAWLKDPERQRAQVFDFTADTVAKEQGPEAYQAHLDRLEALKRTSRERARARTGYGPADHG